MEAWVMARSFSSSGDKITYTLGTLSATTTFSLSVWLNPTNFANDYAIITVISTSTGIAIRNSGKIAVYFSSTIDPGTIALNAGVWNHVCVTSNVGTGNYRLYVNGTLDTATTVGAVAQGTWQIGGTLAGWGPMYVGSTADLAWFNTNLTAAEVTALAKGARPNTFRSLLQWFPLGGMGSTTEPDLSGNANNGTVTGTSPAFGPPIMQFTPRWPQFVFSAAPPPPVFILMPQIVT
jgi:hypothetical protein